MSNWYEDSIDPPMRTLVRDLRDNGFNTVWSCGHLPRPYVAFDSYRENEEELLNTFLEEGGYQNYIVSNKHFGAIKRKRLTVVFHFLPGVDGELVNEEYLKLIPDEKEKSGDHQIPLEIVELIEEDWYKNYQPIQGYAKTSFPRKQMYDEIVEAFTQFGVKGKKILEAGPLYGYYSFELTKLGATVVGVERDELRCNVASKLAEFYGLDVEFVNEDFMKYPFKGQGFDVFLCMNVYHHFLATSPYLAMSLLNRISREVPEMFFCMGIQRGSRVFGLSHDDVGKLILSFTDYKYCKKIGKWSSRYVWYFSH